MFEVGDIVEKKEGLDRNNDFECYEVLPDEVTKVSVEVRQKDCEASRQKDCERSDADSDPMLRGGSTPSQYDLPSRAVTLQDLIEYRGMNFARGNIFKAAFRMGHKDTTDDLYDINKIIWFATRERNRILAERRKEDAK